MARSGADEQGFAGRFDDFLGDAVELVDVADARDLGEEALDEPEVAVGDAGDGGDGFGVGEVVGVDGQAEFLPAVRTSSF
ncbi:hypothetical protein ABIB26_004294 [Arthrobacter sp. UYEF20]